VAPREGAAEERSDGQRGVDDSRGGRDRADGQRVRLRRRVHARRAEVPRAGRRPVQRALREKSRAQGSAEAVGRRRQPLDGVQQQNVLASLVAPVETGHRVLNAGKKMSFEFDNTGTLWWTLIFIEKIYLSTRNFPAPLPKKKRRNGIFDARSLAILTK